MSFRKEKKFKLSHSDMALIQEELNIKGIQELHPPRTINSCYFDNDEMNLFIDSEEGVLPRKKVRVRWYNNVLNFKKETKISSIEGRYKYSENVPQINNKEDVLKTIFFDLNYGKLTPKIIINYSRHYFLLDKLRITFDKNINYRHVSSGFNQIIQDQECGMEVKTSLDCNDNYIEKVLPYSTSRFSKYSRGLLKFQKAL